ncbi:GTP-binding protein HflX [Herbinix hemicellulosilytica]|uniref:GTPase HflX n=1 Tax=Herbinix hemicellulosilytica TaxID=1564487 RepID=A0A0H5SJ22_HERHM|nr:GTPase HflX [Herbinix hemicellulosilytica]RBP58465.1 GTP-binding protein HflX [Herbinix hemicellulosilytica]CRZ35070.1 GTPase HflX [Herbinix hemicellulosilytica]
MAKFYEFGQQEESFILIGVALADNDDDIKESLEELKELTETAGATAVGMVIQNREKIHPTTYIGKGKIEEVRQLITETGATGVICDDELTPAQLRNLEDALQTKVLDRTVLILDIFAKRASTKEGKIQVEMAQLKFNATRLVGIGNSLSRLGGGIGTRGPGEKKLETDRRLIRERIAQLKRELEDLKKNREVARNLRSKSNIPVISIVGYTNAGKSTLLNHLTNAGVLEEDKLFATLDPTTRSFTMDSGQQVLFTDTVGFIRKLPHHLIDAFRSTLEEAKYADIILHVVDSVNPNAYKQMHIVYETLSSLGIKDKPIITAFNKQDLLEDDITLKDFKADYTVKISAKNGTGIDKLLEIIEKILMEQKALIEETIPYNEAGKLQTIRKYGRVLEEEYKENGIYIKAYISKDKYYKI